MIRRHPLISIGFFSLASVVGGTCGYWLGWAATPIVISSSVALAMAAVAITTRLDRRTPR